MDLRAQYLSIREEVDEAVARVLERGNYVMGEEVEGFETEWARYCGAKHCIGVSSGTDALHLSLRAVTWFRKQAVRVLTTPFTFFATTQAIIQSGNRPVFIDVDIYTGNIHLEKGPSTLAHFALPVHLYGRPTPIPERSITASGRVIGFPVPIIEDSAQAHGVPLRGTAACHSFYPSKNIGAIGQAGAVVTNDADLAARVRELRVYGERERFVHHATTGNHRMDELQAAILRVKLRHLPTWTMKRRGIAGIYMNRLNGLPGIVVPPDHRQHVYHIFAIRVTDPRGRDDLARFLTERGVETAVRYPVPLHLQPALAFLGHKEGDFPNAERWAREVLTLPIYSEMDMDMVNFVAEGVRQWTQMGR